MLSDFLNYLELTDLRRNSDIIQIAASAVKTNANSFKRYVIPEVDFQI